MELYTWSELATIILAVVGIFSSFFLQKKTTKEIIFLRVLSLYTIINLLIYSIIPYKTPWSILPFLQAAIILAGFGFFSLYQLGEKMKRIVMMHYVYNSAFWNGERLEFKPLQIAHQLSAELS